MAARDYGSEMRRLELWNEALREALDDVFTMMNTAISIGEPGDILEMTGRLYAYLTALRSSPTYPDSPVRARVLKMLELRWYEHMDDNSIHAHTFSHGLASMGFAAGAITDTEAADYCVRIKRCPLDGKHEDSRLWCAYCGDIRKVKPGKPGRIPMLCRECRVAYDILADGDGSTVDQRYGYCSETCSRKRVARYEAAEFTL